MYKDNISTHPLNVARLEARLAMEKNPDDHPCESAAILHELLNEMENLRVELLVYLVECARIKEIEGMPTFPCFHHFRMARV
ncbi:hypothetical protein Tco_0315466, partial [Tanacetum coccineum]